MPHENSKLTLLSLDTSRSYETPVSALELKPEEAEKVKDLLQKIIERLENEKK